MKAALVFLLSVLVHAGVVTHERTVVVDKDTYLVRYEVPDCSAPDWSGCTSSVPATMPPGQPHYGATITVFKIAAKGEKVQLGQSFGGQWTDKGCFEDDPKTLTEYALAHKDDPPPVKIIPAGKSSNLLIQAANGTAWIECVSGNISLDPVIDSDGVSVLIKARICKDGKWKDASVRMVGQQ